VPPCRANEGDHQPAIGGIRRDDEAHLLRQPGTPSHRALGGLSRPVAFGARLRAECPPDCAGDR